MSTVKGEFIEIYNRCIGRAGADKLLQWLQASDFFTAPASTRFHLSREGGLCEHSLHVYHRLRQLYIVEVARSADLSAEQEETVAICGLLHDVCKTGMYVLEPKNKKSYEPEKVQAAERWQVKHDEGGDFVWETVMGYKIEDTLPYGHGEKSVYIISGFLKLSREEAMAIRWHMGFSDNDFKGGGYSVGNAFEKFPLAVLTHMADLQASYLDEATDSGQ